MLKGTDGVLSKKSAHSRNGLLTIKEHINFLSSDFTRTVDFLYTIKLRKNNQFMIRKGKIKNDFDFKH